MAILPVGHAPLNRIVTTTMESLRLLLVARPPYLSYQGPARLAAGVVLQTAGGETRVVRAVQGPNP